MISMKKTFVAAVVASLFAVALPSAVYAEEPSVSGAQISPVSNTITLIAGEANTYTFEVKNPNESDMATFNIYASPYSYSYSEEEDEYKLGFSNENKYSQIARWISFKNDSGSFVSELTVSLNPLETKEITYRVSAPQSMPNGGQYAVIFAQTVNNSTGEGIKTSARTGLLVYGHATGETIRTAEFSNTSISPSFMMSGNIYADTKVKNTGNTDLTASSKFVIQGILNNTYYENEKKTSVIPEVELKIHDEWEKTPFFGLFKVTWTITYDITVETMSRVVLIMPLTIMIIMFILLTILTIWLIVIFKKRKERRSRNLI